MYVNGGASDFHLIKNQDTQYDGLHKNMNSNVLFIYFYIGDIDLIHQLSNEIH